MLRYAVSDQCLVFFFRHYHGNPYSLFHSTKAEYNLHLEFEELSGDYFLLAFRVALMSIFAWLLCPFLCGSYVHFCAALMSIFVTPKIYTVVRCSLFTCAKIATAIYKLVFVSNLQYFIHQNPRYRLDHPKKKKLTLSKYFSLVVQ